MMIVIGIITYFCYAKIRYIVLLPASTVVWFPRSGCFWGLRLNSLLNGANGKKEIITRYSLKETTSGLQKQETRYRTSVGTQRDALAPCGMKPISDLWIRLIRYREIAPANLGYPLPGNDYHRVVR